MIRRIFAAVIRPPYVWCRETTTHLLFERRLGVKTSGVVELADLGLAAEGRVRYRPIGWLLLRRILPPSAVTPEDVFLDIGSGMGRAVLLAAHYPFKRVLGVELSAQLVDCARRNIAQTRADLRCTTVEFTHADAVDYQIPDDVTVVLMNNPVRGAVFAAVVRNILDSYDRAPRPMRIIYGNPIEEPMLLETGRVRLVRRVRGFRPGAEWSRSNSIRLYEVMPA